MSVKKTCRCGMSYTDPSVLYGHDCSAFENSEPKTPACSCGNEGCIKNQIAQLKAELEHWKQQYVQAVENEVQSVEELGREREANGKLKALLRELPLDVPEDAWTNHPGISYHEIQVEKSWLKEARALLGDSKGEV